MTHRPTQRTASSLKKFSVSDRDILDRRVRTNPRYAGVQARTNTGFNTHRRQELDREIRKYYKVRYDEDFRRISLGDLIQLMVTHSIDAAAAEEEEEEEERRRKEEGEEEEEGKTHRFPLKYQDELKKVVHGMEHMMAHSSKSAPQRPYLILDIRIPQDFQKGHLATAINHPSARLSRAVGWECDPLLAHKNRPGSVIVVCDESEESGPAAVSILQHRGYSNVMLLSGGLRLARDKIGPPLVTTAPTTAATAASVGLPLQTALLLQDQLAVTVLPPLSVSEGQQWWNAAETNAVSARTTQRSLDNATVRRPPPWR